jgi:hypothetical protein
MIALYFAVEDDPVPDKDGVIWGLLPSSLNQAQFGLNCICPGDHRDIQPLFLGAFEPSKEPLASGIAAVFTKQWDMREAVQQSVFTIHSPCLTLEELPNADTFIDRIEIPAESKMSIRADLQTLGVTRVTRATIYPDLENLAKYLKKVTFAKLTLN